MRSTSIPSARRNENDEEVLFGRFHTYLGRCTDEQRADIERSAAFVGRHEALAFLDNRQDSLVKFFGGQLGHHDAAARALQAGGILVHAEDADFAVFPPEGLHTLESLLSIVQTGGCHVYFECLRAGNRDVAPFSVLVGASYVVVSGHIAE